MRWILAHITAGVIRWTVGLTLGASFILAGVDPQSIVSAIISDPPMWLANPLLRVGLVALGVVIIVSVFFWDRYKRRAYHALDLTVHTPYERWKDLPKYNLEKAASIWAGTRDERSYDRDQCFNRLKHAIRNGELPVAQMNGPKPNIKTVVRTSDLKDWFVRKGLMERVKSETTQDDGGSPVADWETGGNGLQELNIFFAETPLLNEVTSTAKYGDSLLCRIHRVAIRNDAAKTIRNVRVVIENMVLVDTDQIITSFIGTRLGPSRHDGDMFDLPPDATEMVDVVYAKDSKVQHGPAFEFRIRDNEVGFCLANDAFPNTLFKAHYEITLQAQGDDVPSVLARFSIRADEHGDVKLEPISVLKKVDHDTG
jgi:hypothetical protein